MTVSNAVSSSFQNDKHSQPIVFFIYTCISRLLTFGRFYIWAKSTNLKPFDRYLLILGTEAQDGLKAWCDNNSWFCDCTDGGQLDDLFDDVGNFTEVNTGKTVLFDISQITIMKILVEIG